MVTHPDIQSKAQDEIDRIIGHDRLPTFEDREKLPYINALVKETLRWRTTVPLGEIDYVHNRRSDMNIWGLSISNTACDHAG